MCAATQRHFLDFEQPLSAAWELLNKTPVHTALYAQRQQLLQLRHTVTSSLSAWQTVQLSRHPNRPDTLTYLQHITNGFTELHGDRYIQDDASITGGLATFNGQTAMFIGHQQGHMLGFGLAAGIIPEPPGGAHWHTAQAATYLAQAIAGALEQPVYQSSESRIRQRIEKYAAIGFWEQKG